MRLGSQGEAVKDVQTLLNIFGANLVVDGIFGPNTEASVKFFQSQNQLLVDGIVGPQTMAALSKGTSVPFNQLKSLPILRHGSRGEDVVKLQKTLNQTGANLVVDGIFGPKTEAAVKYFQTQKGLVVDGIGG